VLSRSSGIHGELVPEESKKGPRRGNNLINLKNQTPVEEVQVEEELKISPFFFYIIFYLATFSLFVNLEDERN